MRGRKPDQFVLEKQDKLVLRELLRHGCTSQRVAQRARILLWRADGLRVNRVADKVDQNPATVWRVCERYRQRGLEAALHDAPRTGRPRVFSPQDTEAD